jgi:hypothetical protein
MRPLSLALSVTAALCSIDHVASAQSMEASNSPPPIASGADVARASASPSPSPAPPREPPGDTRVDPRIPGSGRVPLGVESVRGVQSLGITVEHSGFAMNYERLCTTPCTLYVPPGRMTLFTDGVGIAPGDTELDVPPSGLRVRLLAPSSTAVVATRALFVTGALSAIAGIALFAGAIADASDASHAGGPPTATTWGLVAGGAVATTLGVALVLTAALMPGTRAGIAERRPLASASRRRWRWGAAIAPGTSGAEPFAATVWLQF